MAKQSGLGDQMYIAGVDLGADINSISSLSTPRATLPATGITMSGEARMFGLRDATGEFIAFFNDSAGGAHPTLKTLPTTDVHLMYVRGSTQGSEAFCLVGKEVDYAPTRGDDGALTFSVNVSSSAFGADWATLMTNGKRTDTTATNGTSVDFTTAANPASAAFGFQAYLQVFSFTGTSATIKLQESSDNAVGDPFADVTGGAFTTVTGVTAERIQSSSATLSVERYLRVVTSGTFSNLVFAVAVIRNDSLRAL
jgi:hypothetical protein